MKKSFASRFKGKTSQIGKEGHFGVVSSAGRPVQKNGSSLLQSGGLSISNLNTPSAAAGSQSAIASSASNLSIHPPGLLPQQVFTHIVPTTASTASLKTPGSTYHYSTAQPQPQQQEHSTHTTPRSSLAHSQQQSMSSFAQPRERTRNDCQMTSSVYQQAAEIHGVAQSHAMFMASLPDYSLPAAAPHYQNYSAQASSIKNCFRGASPLNSQFQNSSFDYAPVRSISLVPNSPTGISPGFSAYHTPTHQAALYNLHSQPQPNSTPKRRASASRSVSVEPRFDEATKAWKYSELGGLGANIGSEDWQRAKQRSEAASVYARNIQDYNKQRLRVQRPRPVQHADPLVAKIELLEARHTVLEDELAQIRSQIDGDMFSD